jgi:uncharacterized protein (TIGR00369 family)
MHDERGGMTSLLLILEFKIMTTNAPEGFIEFPGKMGFIALTGPLMMKLFDGGANLGLRVEEKHCNPAGICHGGLLMTIADMQLGLGSQAALKMKQFLPTIQMNCDFVSPTPNGAWIEGTTEVTKRTRNMIFATCKLTADGKTVFSGSGIMKIPSEKDPNFGDVKLPVEE